MSMKKVFTALLLVGAAGVVVNQCSSQTPEEKIQDQLIDACVSEGLQGQSMRDVSLYDLEKECTIKALYSGGNPVSPRNNAGETISPSVQFSKFSISTPALDEAAEIC